MKLTSLALGTACAVALTIGVGTQVASADTAFRVCSGSAAPIWTGPGGSNATVEGYLQPGEVFSWDGTAQNSFYRGYAYGSVHNYGWMSSNYAC